MPGIAIAKSLLRTMLPCTDAPTPTTPDSARVLKWAFRRGSELLECELGLTSDQSSYQLRLVPVSSPACVTIELFDDVLTAFQRQARLEQRLVAQGWMLEAFESEPDSRA